MVPLARASFDFRAYIYCSDWMGVTMPNFEKIYPQCLWGF
jgi:hypothetical protein